MTAPSALRLESITKRFGETIALDGASFDLRSRTIHALLGENGAGKTTLMRVAFGMVRPDAGRLWVKGHPFTPRATRDAIAAGLGMVHQHFLLVPALTVAENAVLGGVGRYSQRAAAARVQAVAEATGLKIDPHTRVRDLPVSGQQRAELVRALAGNARILILDEPTAVLTPSESDDLYQWMRRFVDAGGTIVLITHKLREALAVADDVTVMQRGRTVLTGVATELTEGALIDAIVGEQTRPTADAPSRPPSPQAPAALTLHHVTWHDAAGIPRLRDVSLSIRAGEILGVLGVEGAGQAELLRILAGRLTPTTGRADLPPRIGFIPADRVHEAIIPAMTVTENLVLANAGTLRGTIDWSARRAESAHVLREYSVRAAGPDALLASLSGGNQQRLVVGRERRVTETALVAENPMRGLDVRATKHVMDVLRDFATDGGCVVVYSSDIDEVLALTSRIVVCFAGTVREVAPPANPADRTPYARALMGLTE